MTETCLAEWYTASDKSKHMTQIVVEIPSGMQKCSEFSTLMLAPEKFPLVLERWGSSFIHLDNNPGPFLLVRADQFVKELCTTPIVVGFTFCKFDCGGLFVLFVRFRNQTILPKLKSKFSSIELPVIESLMGLDNSNNVKEISGAFRRDTLHLVLAENSTMTMELFDPSKGKSIMSPAPLVKYDIKVPIPSDIQTSLQNEFQQLIMHHQSVPSIQRNWKMIQQRYGGLQPLSAEPILPRPVSQQPSNSVENSVDPSESSVQSIASTKNTLAAAREKSVPEVLFSFKGRISRSEYWLKGVLPCFIVIGIPNIILNHGIYNENPGPASLVLSAFSLWPSLALYLKRLHDHNRSGWFLLTLLIPFLNIVFAIWILIETWLLRGTVGPNRFGDDPLEGASSNNDHDMDESPKDGCKNEHIVEVAVSSDSSPIESCEEMKHTGLSLPQNKQKKNIDDSPTIPLHKCPHCLTSGILPMPGNICPNCKKNLSTG